MIEKIKLEDLIEFQRGYDLPKRHAVKGNYKVISSNGILAYHNKYKSGPSVVIGRSGTVGKPQLIEEKFWPHNTTLFVKDFKGNNIIYIYYLLSNLNIDAMKSGSNIPTLNRNHLHPLKILATKDKTEQRKISNILYLIDTKIKNNNQINSNLEELMKTIYQRWFIEFEFPNEEGKPYKSSGGKLVYNDILKRQIPEKWIVKKINNLTNVVTGKEDANFSTKNGKYKFFTCSNDSLQCDVSAFEGSSILIAGNGDFNVKHYTGKFNAYQRTYVLIPYDTSIYGIMYLSALYKIKSLKKGSNGSIVKFITKNDVENIDVIIPNQKEFLNELNQIIFKIEKNKVENDKLKELKEFILPLLMNGQINVNDIEI